MRKKTTPASKAPKSEATEQEVLIQEETEESLNKTDRGILGSILDELTKFENPRRNPEQKAHPDSPAATVKLDQDKSESGESYVRLAFDLDVTGQQQGEMSGLGVYRNKVNLIPDEVIKRITGPGGDDLVCQILTARSNHAALMARPRENRHDTGFDLVPKDKSRLPDDAKKMEALMLEVEKVKEFIWSTGARTTGEHEVPSFSQFVKMISRDGLRFGRYATELIRDENDKLVAFRAADAGTIYRTVNYKELGKNENIRKTALAKIKKLYQLIGKEFDEKRYENGEYIYAQVVRGKPEAVFTKEEMVVHNMYPVTDIEFGGYPLTPIDQAIHAITTHINITMHNKLYFQHGRAARGMLVVKSKSVDARVLQTIKQQFQQTINSVKNSHRMPVFGVGPDDAIEWKPIDNSSRDMEFSFLSDNNARVILGAFQMSPDELPGYSHLSRGSNSQSLSESNNEFKLTAARDVGLRPFILDLQDFFNRNILAEISPTVAEYFSLVFAGLDKEDPNKESARLQQDLGVWMSMNEVFDTVEKERIPKEVGGDLILNQAFWMQAEKYLSFGEILENFFGKKGAAKDPRFQFYQNQFWLQAKQMEQMEVQGRIQLMLASMQPPPPPGMAGPDQGGGEDPNQDPNQGGDPNQKMQKSEIIVSPETSSEFEALMKRWEK